MYIAFHQNLQCPPFCMQIKNVYKIIDIAYKKQTVLFQIFTKKKFFFKDHHNRASKEAL